MTPFIPSKWQEASLNAPEDCDLGMFGGRGRGATTSALFLVLRAADKYHGSNHLFIRTQLGSLREVEDTLAGILAGVYGSKNLRFNRQEHHVVLSNGSTIHFSPLSDYMDAIKLQGLSFDTITADEYGAYSPEQIRMLDSLRANLRGSTQCPRRFVFLANPFGRAHSQIVRRFVTKCPPFVPTLLDDGTTFIHVPGTWRDNPNLPPTYERDLRASCHGDAAKLASWSDGSWASARGAALADVIDESKQLFDARNSGIQLDHQSCHKVLSCDWGTASPAVCYLGLVMLSAIGRYPRHSILLLDEVASCSDEDYSVGLNWSPGRLFEEIGAMCDRWQIRNRSGVLDDARGLQNDTVISIARQYGLFFDKPIKGRTAALAKTRELLFNSKNQNQRPGLWVSNLCTGWWNTVPLLGRDSKNPEQPDAKSGQDHHYDAPSYLITHTPRIMRVRHIEYGNAPPLQTIDQINPQTLMDRMGHGHHNF
jgi:hypothetical protein